MKYCSAKGPKKTFAVSEEGDKLLGIILAVHVRQHFGDEVLKCVVGGPHVVVLECMSGLGRVGELNNDRRVVGDAAGTKVSLSIVESSVPIGIMKGPINSAPYGLVGPGKISTRGREFSEFAIVEASLELLNFEIFNVVPPNPIIFG